MDEPLGLHDASVGRVREIIGGMDDAALGTLWWMVLGGTEIASMPHGKVLRSVTFNHWYDRRGQLTVYLRLAGALVPATYAASTDETPFLGELKTDLKSAIGTRRVRRHEVG